MVDGKRTEPENIADQAGLKIALQVSTRKPFEECCGSKTGVHESAPPNI